MPFPHFNPVLVQIGPFAVRWYALAYIAGITLGWRYAIGLVRNLKLWRGTRPTLNATQVDDFVLWVTFGIILGGRIGYDLFYMIPQDPHVLSRDPLALLRIWEGGMSFHGGLIGVAIAIVWFARRAGVEIVRLADLTAPCVPFGLFFGRIANFINGELWGRTTTVPWGIVFPRAGDLPRHPSQLYEAALEGVVLFCVLRFATHGRKLLPRRGAVCGLFLLGYGLSRIALENVREPDVGMPNFPFGLTMGILLSIPLVLGGAWLLWRSARPDALAPPDAAPAPEAGTPGALPPETAADSFITAETDAASAYAPDGPARPA